MCAMQVFKNNCLEPHFFQSFAHDVICLTYSKWLENATTGMLVLSAHLALIWLQSKWQIAVSAGEPIPKGGSVTNFRIPSCYSYLLVQACQKYTFSVSLSVAVETLLQC